MSMSVTANGWRHFGAREAVNCRVMAVTFSFRWRTKDAADVFDGAFV